ncbi:MAG: hypothetical protein N3G20_01315, partial [Verrucomicrobiae bacterium]|nr:hypothetical protein [Verrucomicrobiae bacterium]
MSTGADRELLAQLPSMTELLKTAQVSGWLKEHPQGLVTACLRQAVAEIRELIIEGRKKGCTAGRVSIEMVLGRAGELLRRRVAPRVRGAINATGIILHTGLGRAVFPERVVDSVVEELKGYCTLAVDRDTGERIERDEPVSYTH